MAEGDVQEAATGGKAVRPVRVLLAGGGTAGHVNPLLATASALASGPGGATLLALGTREGLESSLVPAAGLDLAFVPRVPMPRRPTADLVKLPARLRGAVAAARQAIEQVGADVVVGFGGYVSTPAYLAARSMGVPVVIHEQNARPGLANRLGARWAGAVALTFASTPLRAAKGSTTVTGLPLRQVIGELACLRSDPVQRARVRKEAAGRLGMDADMPTVLVTGGSLGAQHLNEVMESVIPMLPQGLQVIHLTGKGKDEAVRRALGAATHYKVLDYLSDMHLAYALADGVICRSGAGTVAELAALGLPALFVPLPIGNGEQRLNAADMIAAGGATLVKDDDFSEKDVLNFIEVIMDPARREAMGQAAANSGTRDAASRLAQIIREVAGSPSDATATPAEPSDKAGQGEWIGCCVGYQNTQAAKPLAGQAFHLIGIGGAGMSVVAQLLAQEGAIVTGSDAHESATLEQLHSAGITAWVGHDASQVPQDARVVISTAIKESNPELAAARAAGMDILHRSQALALAAGERAFVAVAGAHGKTTTSGMLAQALVDAGEDPSFAVGGVVRSLATGAHVGSGRAFIAEADESDRSFLNYRPTIEVVTNVEPDHLDNYGSREAFEEAFLEFSRRLVPGGLLVACSDDPGAARLAAGAASEGRRVLTFGTQVPQPILGEGHVLLTVTEQGADHTTSDVTRLDAQGRAVGAAVTLRLAAPGVHVALDAAGAWAAGCELGIDPAVMARCLGGFHGTKRRFEDRGEAAGVRVVDDYAHHPTEVAALLTAAREVAGARGGKLRVLFQPHLFSRTANFASEFAQALSKADDAIVTAIYPARETQEDFPGVTGETVTAHLAGRARYIADREEAAHALAAAACPGDLLLTVGAGDITEMADVIVADLAAREAAQ